MDAQARELVAACEMADLGRFAAQLPSLRRGRKQADRLAMLIAFLAKSIYRQPTTEALHSLLLCNAVLRGICGWRSAREVPSLSTFSRVFAQIARMDLIGRIHKAMVARHTKGRLVGHVTRDSVAVPAREKPAPKAPKPPAPPKRRRGRPAKGTPPAPPEPPRRLELQGSRTLKENLADLPRLCDCGSKRDSKGKHSHWIGYKLHIDTIDGDIPVSGLLTSASTHDSQCAIPLAQMTAARLSASLYDLMDAAYDAPEIHAFSRSLGHVPIIDHNPRRGVKRPMEPARLARYAQRTASERVNSQLMDNYGGRFLRVRGAAKVTAHLMFGLVAITAAQLIRAVT
jgi:hypothetical protein